MALKKDFYEEVFNKEKYWMELLDRKLLNIYYLKEENGLKDFYKKKLMELQEEYRLSENPILKTFIDMIKDLLAKIDNLTISYMSNKDYNINEIMPLFVTNRMNNYSKKEGLSELARLQIKKQILENLKNQYVESNSNDIDDDYAEEVKVA